MTDLLDILAKITRDGDSVTVRYSRSDKGTVQLLIQPVLGGEADLVTDKDEQQARAALQRPLCITGSHHGAVVAELGEYMARSADDRDTLRSAVDDMSAATRSAAKHAAKAAADKKAKGGTKQESGTKQDGPAANGAATPTDNEAADSAGNPEHVF